MPWYHAQLLGSESILGKPSKWEGEGCSKSESKRRIKLALFYLNVPPDGQRDCDPGLSCLQQPAPTGYDAVSATMRMTYMVI